MTPRSTSGSRSGPPLVSANFVIPYPPGFPIMVPGQVIKADTIEFMRKLDVKEIHGYDATLGLKLISPERAGKDERPVQTRSPASRLNGRAGSSPEQHRQRCT